MSQPNKSNKSKYLTGDRNLDMEILMNLRDDELSQVCMANRYIKEICDSEIFWIKRLIKRLEIAKLNIKKLLGKVKEIPINRENIEKTKEYFGFDTNKELNDYFNRFKPNVSYQIFYLNSMGDHFDSQINVLHASYHNIKLTYHLKKEVVYAIFHPNEKGYIEIPSLVEDPKSRVPIRVKLYSSDILQKYKKAEFI